MKTALVSVTSDLVTDRRVDRTCRLLQKMDYKVVLTGRKRKCSLPLQERNYKTIRFSLLFEKGPLFYVEYNLRLFFFLLFHRADMVIANDLDTLLPNFIFSRIKRIPLVYDSHEYFTGAESLTKRPFVRSIWKTLEKAIFPSLKHVITVNESIAGIYKNEYGVEVQVVRNIPEKLNLTIKKSRTELGLPEALKIIIMQGAHIDHDRGAEEAVQAMKYIDDALLLIIGSGLAIDDLIKIVKNKALEKKIIFKNTIAYEELIQYTLHADLGLTLDKDIHINYKYSLPNKLFDYIHAGVPVLATALPEVTKVFQKYNIGELIPAEPGPELIAMTIRMMLTDKEKRNLWKENLKKAAQEYCWEKEEGILKRILNNATAYK